MKPYFQQLYKNIKVKNSKIKEFKLFNTKLEAEFLITKPTVDHKSLRMMKYISLNCAVEITSKSVDLEIN